MYSAAAISSCEVGGFKNRKIEGVLYEAIDFGFLTDEM
jgi:hypothetical protein